MTAGSLTRIERLNYGIGGALVIAAALTQNQPRALGVAVGVLLTCLNFALLSRVVGKMTKQAASGGDSSRGAMMILPKMVGLMIAVVLSLAFLPIDPMAFAIGYSVFVASIFVEITLAAILPAPPSPTEPDELNHG